MATETLKIQAKSVCKTDLGKLLDELSAVGKFEYVIVSGWREIRFVRFQDRQPEWLASSDSGRAFGPQAELKWRRSEDGKEFLCRWIFEGLEPPAQEGEMDLADKESTTFEVDTQAYLLWGEWLADANCWYTARIPRRLEYPTDPPTNGDGRTPLTLQVREYKRGGQVYFERFVGLATYDGSQAAQKTEVE